VNEERLGSTSEFAAAVARHLAAFAEPAWPLPTHDELARLVEVTFFASLHEEETRRTEFNVAWQPVSGDSPAVVAMTTPVRATPKSLTKLAPATEREATSIAVRRDGADLVAWALLQRSSTPGSPLTIWALAPGVLRVDYAGIPRALYARGEIFLQGGDHEVKSPARALTKAFARWAAEADPSSGIDLRAAVVTRIAARALALGHGGMILLVPADVTDAHGVRVHYAVGEGNDVLAKRYADVTRGTAVDRRLERLQTSRARAVDGRLRVRDEAQLAFAEAIELVARLTAIDNAVMLDTDLRIRGFGVQVLESEAPRMTFEHVNPYSDDVHVDDLSTFKGTRHPAGVIFCMRQEREAAAIIASQDGRLSLAIKDARGVVEVLGSFERAFGWR
jgi:sensor domain DACNV-containing protein